ncbi:MAG: AAA family ATPase, partial [Planctomycetota bacterium]
MFFLTCDHCSKRYKLKEPLPPGKKVACKACGAGTLQPEQDKKTPDSAQVAADDQAMVEQVGDAHKAILGEVRKAIIGQQEVVEQTLTCIFAGGHALLIGVPGLAKTLLVNSIAKALGVGFKRIQFTPDLMPSDITGTDIIQDDPTTGTRA